MSRNRGRRGNVYDIAPEGIRDTFACNRFKEFNLDAGYIANLRFGDAATPANLINDKIKIIFKNQALKQKPVRELWTSSAGAFCKNICFFIFSFAVNMNAPHSIPDAQTKIPESLRWAFGDFLHQRFAFAAYRLSSFFARAFPANWTICTMAMRMRTVASMTSGRKRW